MDLLRFVTAGNVDDGKSTLIGRLLHDIQAIMDDQLEAIEVASKKRGFEYTNLALLTDGLKAEREQGITIDVAYRYFSTAKRKFIIADCPGHIQYTRNMVTGASTANMAVILVDARKGVVEQTRRHSFVASMLRIPHLVICINKMDLVEYDQEVFKKIQNDFLEFSKKLEINDIQFIPMSALLGENVIERSSKMRWYKGYSFFEHLESVQIASDVNSIDFRFPVQTVITVDGKNILKNHQFNPEKFNNSQNTIDIDNDYHNRRYGGRRYGGMISSGSIQVGDAVIVLPSGVQTNIIAIEIGDRKISIAKAKMSVVFQLEHEIDISRGDMLVRPENRTHTTQDIEALICWTHESSLKENKKYLVRHTSTEVMGIVKEIYYKLDINTMMSITHKKSVELNDFARVQLRVSKPLHTDLYRLNRSTGSFVLIDEDSYATVAAGMIV